MMIISYILYIIDIIYIIIYHMKLSSFIFSKIVNIILVNLIIFHLLNIAIILHSSVYYSIKPLFKNRSFSVFIRDIKGKTKVYYFKSFNAFFLTRIYFRYKANASSVNVEKFKLIATLCFFANLSIIFNRLFLGHVSFN